MKKILFIDDEPERTLRWYQALTRDFVVYKITSADQALRMFSTPDEMANVDLIVLDLAMYTAGGLSEGDTDHGRLTGDALRRRLRDGGWTGKVVVLSNSRDDGIRRTIEEDGDTFLRKTETMPDELVARVKTLLDVPPDGPEPA